MVGRTIRKEIITDSFDAGSHNSTRITNEAMGVVCITFIGGHKNISTHLHE